MVLLISPTRILTVYVVQGLMFAIILFLAYKTFRRGKNRLNRIFIQFYLSLAMGLFINFIYAPLDDIPIVLYLNFLTHFFLFFGVIFLVIFNFVLLKSEKVFTKKKQYTLMLTYGILLFFGMLILISIPEMGVEIGGPPNYSPIWKIPFFIYVVSIITIFATVPSGYSILKIYTEFEDEELKKKWKQFSLGYFNILTFSYLSFIVNFLDDPTLRLINGVIGFILITSAVYLLYHGVGRQISE